MSLWRVLEIVKIGLGENLPHFTSIIFAKISRHENLPIYGIQERIKVIWAIKYISLQDPVNVKVKEVKSILSAQQVSLEILANLCCSDGKHVNRIYRIWNKFSIHTVLILWNKLCVFIPFGMARVYKTHTVIYIQYEMKIHFKYEMKIDFRFFLSHV